MACFKTNVITCNNTLHKWLILSSSSCNYSNLLSVHFVWYTAKHYNILISAKRIVAIVIALNLNYLNLTVIQLYISFLMFSCIAHSVKRGKRHNCKNSLPHSTRWYTFNIHPVLSQLQWRLHYIQLTQ